MTTFTQPGVYDIADVPDRDGPPPLHQGWFNGRAAADRAHQVAVRRAAAIDTATRAAWLVVAFCGGMLAWAFRVAVL